MPPEPKERKTRVCGIKRNYKFNNYLSSSLEKETPSLDYFSFADAFQGTKRATNYHFADLLKKLSTNQSNKLTKIAQNAKRLFDVRVNTY